MAMQAGVLSCTGDGSCRRSEKTATAPVSGLYFWLFQ